MTPHPANLRAANLLSFFFALVIVVYAASGPLSELVRWIIQTNGGFRGAVAPRPAPVVPRTLAGISL